MINKQIEEMVSLSCPHYDDGNCTCNAHQFGVRKCDGNCSYGRSAVVLYYAGYRKQIENATDTNVGSKTHGSKTQWISVEDRLPEICGMPVLMVAESSKWQSRIIKGFTGYSCPTEFHPNEKGLESSWSTWKVTHWMPRPEPPKGE